jgi:hypothetical protein
VCVGVCLDPADPEFPLADGSKFTFDHKASNAIGSFSANDTVCTSPCCW